MADLIKKIKLKLITTMNLIYFLSETFWKTKMITFIIKNAFLIPFIRQGRILKRTAQYG
jgi:hypothetical protein